LDSKKTGPKKKTLNCGKGFEKGTGAGMTREKKAVKKGVGVRYLFSN